MRNLTTSIIALICTELIGRHILLYKLNDGIAKPRSMSDADILVKTFPDSQFGETLVCTIGNVMFTEGMFNITGIAQNRETFSIFVNPNELFSVSESARYFDL